MKASLVLLFFTFGIGYSKPLEKVAFHNWEPSAVRKTYVELPGIAEQIRKSEQLIVIKGFPHHPAMGYPKLGGPAGEGEVLQFGYVFPRRALELAPELVSKIKGVFGSVKSFVRYSGVKGCGGFAPDFSFTWISGNERVTAHICFTCSEMKAYRKKPVLYCDIPDATLAELKELLDKYRPKKAGEN